MSWCWFKPASAVEGILPATAGEARLRRVERPAVSAAEGLPMFVPTTNFQPQASDLQPQTSRTSKSFAIHSYEKRACKPFGIRSYAIVGLKVPWNEYLQKKAGGGRRVARKSLQHLASGSVLI